jgi:hypothetical protein
LVAFPRFFTFHPGFITFGRLAALTLSVTRPNRVRLRYGLHLCLLRLRQWDCSHLRSIGYMYYE